MSDVEDSLLGIGALAAASGLTVSALRFYDAEGILVPASVDPWNGYRRYGRDQVVDARVLAHLRRVGVALPDLRLVLAWRRDPVAAATALDRHLARLEHGLADARRELSTVRTLINPQESPMPTTVSATVDAASLLGGLRAVRFAASADPALPALCTVLVELEDVLTLVATDRYRLAVATVPIGGAVAAPVQVVVPVSVVDALVLLLSAYEGDVVVTVDEAVTFTVGSSSLRGEPSEDAYPDYRRIIDLPPSRQVVVDMAGLRSSIAGAPTRPMVREQDGVPYDVVELDVSDDALSVIDPASSTDAGIGVNREFLLQALDAGGEGQLTLELDGPISLLAFRPAGGQRFSLLMPTRLG